MDEINMPRDCKHGQLARSCGICDLERELAAAQSKLARYENAVMPEEPAKYPPGEGELEMAAYWWVDADDYDKLRAFAAAETVRADENEADAERYRWLRGQTGEESVFISERSPARFISRLTFSVADAAIDAALKEQT